MAEFEKVILTVRSEWPGADGSVTDTVEMDPDQWHRLTPDEREYLCEKTAVEVFQEHCNYGWDVKAS